MIRSQRGRAARPSAAARWRRLTGSASAAAIAFGLLTCACVVLAVVGPRAGAQLRTRALNHLVATTPAVSKVVVGSLDANSLGTAMNASSIVTATDLGVAEHRLARQLSARLPLTSARTYWTGLTTPAVSFTGAVTQPGRVATQLEIAYRSSLGRYARLIAGRFPVAAGRGQPVQVAITAATAQRFGLRVGSVLTAAGVGSLRVAGILAVTSPASLYWQFDPLVAAPQLMQPQSQPPYWEGGVFVAADSVAAISLHFSPSDEQLTWVFPLALRQLTTASATRLAGTLPAVLSSAGQILFPASQSVASVSLSSGVLDLLSLFTSQSAAVASIVDLMSVGLAVVAATIICLAAWLVAARRRGEFAILRARGASQRQLAAAALSGSAAAAIPGAAAGLALGLWLTRGVTSPLGWWLAALTLAAALIGPVVVTARMHRGLAAGRRPDRQPSRPAVLRRLLAEAALLLAAAGGLAALHQQEASARGGDIYASAGPVLVAVPVAIAVLRLYPLAARLLLRLASRRPGAAFFLGLAAAARVSAAAVLPVFAMILALALVSFGGMVRAAITRGEVTQSWQLIGADAVVAVPGQMTPAQQRALAAVPGVRRTALVAVTSATLGFGGPTVDVLLASPRAYAAFTGATALPQPSQQFTGWTPGSAGRAPVPVLASAGLAATLGRSTASLVLNSAERVPVLVSGSAPPMSAVTAAGPRDAAGLIVLPAAAVSTATRQGAPPGMLLVAGAGLNQVALRAAVRHSHLRDAGVQFRSSVLASLRQAPLQRGASSELALGSAVAAIGCLLVLLLALLLTAEARETTLARAATMGMTPAQSRSLALIESLPLLVSVLIGGAGSALVLAPLVGPDLGLAVFTGSGASVPVRPEPAWLMASAAGLLVLAAAVLTGQAVLAGRRTARSLRIGG